MNKSKMGVLIILSVIALIGTFINYKPKIEKVNITSIEITDVEKHRAKVFENQYILDDFSEKFYTYAKKFKPMILNLDKSFDGVMYIETKEGISIPMMTQDDCIKIENRWYKTDGDFINYAYRFFDENDGKCLRSEDNRGFLYYDIKCDEKAK